MISVTGIANASPRRPTVERSANLAVRLRKPDAFLCGAGELGGDGSFRTYDRRGNDDQDRRHGHSGLNWHLSYGFDERCDALGCMPGGVRMHGLEVIRTEH
jgi:hypothetical protein